MKFAEGEYARLTKIKTNHDRLRTESVDGTILKSPVIGDTLVLIGKPLDENLDHRYVETSKILSIDIQENIWILATLNSQYKLEIVDFKVN